jgi:type II secretory pathway component GspD/PulD (secretin)
LQDEAGIREQRIRVLVQNFIQEGKKRLEQGMLESAREQFAHALELDPGNTEARDLFNHVGTKLGERPESVATMASEVRDKIVVRRVQNQIKAEELMKSGKAAMETGAYDQAIRNFEDALLIVRWNPYLDVEALEEGTIQALLETAKDAHEKQEQERERELQARIYKEQEAREKKEQEMLANRISRLFVDANNAYMNDRFKECELYLDELLKVDPTNEMAIELKTLSMRTRHSTTRESLRKGYKKQWRKTFDELEYDDLPQLQLLQFPTEEEWERISMRGKSELASAEQARSPEDEAVFQKLATTMVAASFEQASLDEVVEYLKATTGINILISPTIIESGEEPLFDLITPPRPALDQLDILLKEVAMPPLKYKIDNGVVTILSQEDPMGDYILDVYDIRDLSKVIANFPAKDFNLTPSKAMEEYLEDEDEDNPDVIAADILVDLIQTNIEPSSWEDDENNTISPIQHFLVVKQSQKVHDMINQLLTDLRASVGVLVNIETRFIVVEDNFLEDIGVDFRGLDGNINDLANPLGDVPNVLLDDFGDGQVPGGYGSESQPEGLGSGNEAGIYYDDGEDGDLMGRLENLLDIQLGEDETLDNAGGTTIQFTYLDDVKLQAILRAVSKSSTSNIIQAPSLTVYNGERAHITLVKHVSYVKDFEPEIAQSAVIAEPIVAVARDGLILDVRPVVSSDRRFITMELRPTVALLKRNEDGSLPQFTTGLGVGESVTVELPELEVKRLRTTVTMPDGATLLLGGMKISNEQKFDTGLPFFKHIPIVSFFLSRKAQYESKRKLLILVKGTIIIPEETEPKIGISK